MKKVIAVARNTTATTAEMATPAASAPLSWAVCCTVGDEEAAAAVGSAGDREVDDDAGVEGLMVEGCGVDVCRPDRVLDAVFDGDVVDDNLKATGPAVTDVAPVVNSWFTSSTRPTTTGC